ncbi:hypothetical protein CY35_09G041400 [Sphagnum magellanicum]|nr:hypothetical protein CY35_09G041400 [Sphagnum magellanicum]
MAVMISSGSVCFGPNCLWTHFQEIFIQIQGARWKRIKSYHLSPFITWTSCSWCCHSSKFCEGVAFATSHKTPNRQL